ncbi:uncharacterized protein [Kogia breviceps]|uniref:uncharacterized protein n=1 Tax=Kogia breviceps TaxID=27615 RepID=UPI0034D2088B
MLSAMEPAQQGQKLALWFPSCSLRDVILKMLASVQREKGKFKKINTDDKNNRKAAKFLKHLFRFPSLPVKSVLWSSAPDVEGFSWYSLFLLLALFYVIEMTSSRRSQKIINCNTYFRNGEYLLSIDVAGIRGGMLWCSARTPSQEEALLRALEAEALGGGVSKSSPQKAASGPRPTHLWQTRLTSWVWKKLTVCCPQACRPWTGWNRKVDDADSRLPHHQPIRRVSTS